MSRSLEGQVALVTGAGRGIGRAVALALGDAGAAVAVCARSHEEVRRVADEVAGRHGPALAIRCDVSHRQEVEGMVAAVQEKLGPVDLLVNNAGQLGPVSPLAETDPDDWWQVVEVNLRGPLYCTRAVLPGMLARRRGRIINVSTSAGLAAVPMLSAYVVSKTALYRLTENLAAETRGQGVAVFALTPGLVRTTISQAALSCGEPSIKGWFEHAFANEEDVPAEVPAALVVQLASGAADVLSGRNIRVNDNLPEMVARAAEIEGHDLYVLREAGPHNFGPKGAASADPSALSHEKHISLTTFKRDGTPVSTPVWCARQNGSLLVFSEANSWKVRRIRHDPHVQIAPSTARGKARAPAVDADAEIIDDVAEVKTLLAQKYGWMWPAYNLVAATTRRLHHQPPEESVTIKITLR